MVDPLIYRELVGKSFRGRYHAFAHKKLEANLPKNKFSLVLEVGAGEGEHVSFVQHQFDSYMLTDIANPIQLSTTLEPRISFEIADVQNLKYSDKAFDRVIVTCVLHHLANPESALNEIRRVVKNGGGISILLPCDPGMTFRLARKLTADRFLRKQGVLNVKYLRAIEHRNHYLSLLGMILEVFKFDQVRMKRYPFNRLSWNFGLFSVIQIKIKD